MSSFNHDPSTYPDNPPLPEVSWDVISLTDDQLQLARNRFAPILDGDMPKFYPEDLHFMKYATIEEIFSPFRPELKASVAAIRQYADTIDDDTEIKEYRLSRPNLLGTALDAFYRMSNRRRRERIQRETGVADVHLEVSHSNKIDVRHYLANETSLSFYRLDGSFMSGDTRYQYDNELVAQFSVFNDYDIPKQLVSQSFNLTTGAISTDPKVNIIGYRPDFKSRTGLTSEFDVLIALIDRVANPSQ